MSLKWTRHGAGNYHTQRDGEDIHVHRSSSWGWILEINGEVVGSYSRLKDAKWYVEEWSR